MATGTDRMSTEKLTLTLPTEIIEDLDKIAAFHKTDREKLLYSYIVDGIASDSLAAKRKEFTDRAKQACAGNKKPAKSIEDIFNNLLY